MSATQVQPWTPERIKGLRVQLGISQQGLAERIGVALPTVNRWEQGYFRPSRHLARILDQIEAETDEHE